jgi:hypothetical protein
MVKTGLVNWIVRSRGEGIALPIHLGVLDAVELRRHAARFGPV